MELRTFTNDSDALVALFEYLKENNAQDLIDAVEYVNRASKLSLLSNMLHQTPRKKDFKNIEFLADFEDKSLDLSITNKSFKQILNTINTNPEKLEKYLETAKILQAKGISRVSFAPSYSNFELFFEKPGVISDMYKTYSDGKISYLKCGGPSIYSDKSYQPLYDGNTTFLLTVENHFNRGDSYRYLWLKNLDFDVSKLPTEEEMSSKKYPKEFMDYLNIKERERLEEIFANQEEKVKTLK